MGEVHQLVATEAFSLQAAGHLVTKIFAPWVQDLALLVESVEAIRPVGALADWQPGAVVRMPFSKKICSDGQTVSSQALMALCGQRHGRRLFGGVERLSADEHDRPDHALSPAGDV
jgi:hypothetical protein